MNIRTNRDHCALRPPTGRLQPKPLFPPPAQPTSSRERTTHATDPRRISKTERNDQSRPSCSTRRMVGGAGRCVWFVLLVAAVVRSRCSVFLFRCSHLCCGHTPAPGQNSWCAQKTDRVPTTAAHVRANSLKRREQDGSTTTTAGGRCGSPSRSRSTATPCRPRCSRAQAQARAGPGRARPCPRCCTASRGTGT